MKYSFISVILLLSILLCACNGGTVGVDTVPTGGNTTATPETDATVPTTDITTVPISEDISTPPETAATVPATDITTVQTTYDTGSEDETSVPLFDSSNEGDTELVSVYTSDSFFNSVLVSTGYITPDGATGDNINYRYTDYIEVKEGDIIESYYVIDDVKRPAELMRFICAFDAENNIVISAGSSVSISTYTVPEDVRYLKISLYAEHMSSTVLKSSNKSDDVTPKESVSDTANTQKPETPVNTAKNIGYFRTTGTLTEESPLTLPTTSVVKNVRYTFTGTLGTFGKIYIGQGTDNDYGASWIEIDESEVLWKIKTSVLNTYTFTHSLTVSEYITIMLDIDSDTKASLTIKTGNGGVYTKTLGFYGFSKEAYFVRADAGTMIDNCVFTVTFGDIKADTYIFGNSYIAVVESPAKWSHSLIVAGCGDNALINSFPGADTDDILPSLNNLLTIGCPKNILWCMGMNDGDDNEGKPSEKWMNGIDIVREKCETLGINLILVTLPSVPSVNNEAKSEFVRNSGYRYIDFAKAVGSQPDGTWYAGMLSADLVHPTEAGANALYERLRCDFPEIMLK